MAGFGEIVEKLIIQFGVDTSELKAGMNDVMSTVKSGMSQAVMGISAAWGVAKIQQGMHQFTAELSEMNRVTKNIEMSIEDLENWKNAAREFGADADQFQRVFTGVNDAMFQMINKNRGVLKRLIDQGLLPDIRDAEGKAKKTEQYVLEMSEALAGMDRRTAANTLRQVAGVTDIDSVEFMMQGTKAMKEQLAATKDLAHFTAKDIQAAKELEKAQAKMAQAMKMIFLPIFRSLVEPMTRFADLCTVLAKHVTMLSPLFVGLALIIGKQMIPMFIRAGLLMKSMFLNPVGLAILALTALILIGEDFMVWLEGGESAFGDFYQACADAFMQIPEIISATIKTITAILGVFGSAFAQIFISIEETVGEVCDDIGDAWDSMISVISSAWGGVVAFLQERWDSMVSAISGAWDSVVTFLQERWDAYVEYLNGRIQSWVDRFEYWAGMGREIWEAMTDALEGNFEGAIEHIKNAFNAFLEPFKEGIEWILDKLGALAEKIPGLSGLVGMIRGVTGSSSGGGSAGEAVPVAAENTTNNSTTNNIDGKIDVTVNNATPEAIEELKTGVADWLWNSKNANASQVPI